jgi:hypothetical protein
VWVGRVVVVVVCVYVCVYMCACMCVWGCNDQGLPQLVGGAAEEVHHPGAPPLACRREEERMVGVGGAVVRAARRPHLCPLSSTPGFERGRKTSTPHLRIRVAGHTKLTSFFQPSTQLGQGPRPDQLPQSLLNTTLCALTSPQPLARVAGPEGGHQQRGFRDPAFRSQALSPALSDPVQSSPKTWTPGPSPAPANAQAVISCDKP